MNIAAVLSAGKGTRLGSDAPKQFLEVGGVPILIRSVKAFLACNEISLCIVASSPEYREHTKSLLNKHFPTEARLRVISGGASRGETLLKILEYMDTEGIIDDCVLLTHDAVRPFITKRIILDNIEACRKFGACNTCIKTVDTVSHSSDGVFLDAPLKRDELFNVQTPQTFNARLMYELIKALDRDAFLSLTDGASVFLASGKPVYIVNGEEYNIKITYKNDLLRAEQIVREYFTEQP